MYTLDTLEDCIEAIASAHLKCVLDSNFFNSIAKITTQDRALTDKQAESATRRLLKYREYFKINNYTGLDNALYNLRQPTRSLDRSRWIKLVDQDNVQAIAIRFVYCCSIETVISELSKQCKPIEMPLVKSDQFTQFYSSDDFTLYTVIHALKYADFAVDSALLARYNELAYMAENPQKFLPGVYNYQLENVHPVAREYAINLLGPPNQDNLYQYADRRSLLGLECFSETQLKDSIRAMPPLVQRLVQRKFKQVVVSPHTYSMQQLIEAIVLLDRFPLLIVLDENRATQEITQLHTEIAKFVPAEQCSVMFRTSNAKYHKFNHFVNKHELNSPITVNTRVVYIKRNKIPKPLLESGWRPAAALTTRAGWFASRIERFLNSMDLVLNYDHMCIPWGSTKLEEIK